MQASATTLPVSTRSFGALAAEEVAEEVLDSGVADRAELS
jgi:hypothetical protein